MDVLEKRAVAEDTLEARGWPRTSPSEGSGAVEDRPWRWTLRWSDKKLGRDFTGKIIS